MNFWKKLFGGLSNDQILGNDENTVFAFAGVSSEDKLACSIQHNTDLLRFLADHKHLNRDSLSTYMNMCERFGMGTNPQKSELLAAIGQITPEQNSNLRSALANVHVNELTECIKELKKSPPVIETVKMIEFIMKNTEMLKKKLF
jgi:hypothetical protein